MSGWWISLLALGAIAWPFLVYWRDQRRRRQLDAEPFPEAWRALLAARVALVGHIPSAQRADYERRVLRFVRDKRFYGCNGLTVTEEMQVLIAALACLLILRPGASVYPRLRSVLVYPEVFRVRHEEPDEFGLVTDEPVEQIGESWHGDRIILSWEDVEAALAGDATNVVAHECAHQLDDDSPATEGAPLLSDYRRWSAVMGPAYEALQGEDSPVIDSYGAESPAEFFAVATEAYFQRGRELREHHPEIYAQLREYYRLDTATI